MSDDSPSTSGSTTAHDQTTDLYCTHKVTKLDTLAGLAVRYNVNVSDIKRANGLLSDTAMFAKGQLLIPTRSLPIGQEYATIAGMIVTQYGRPVGMLPRNDLDDRGSQVSSALDQLRGYYGLGSPTTSGSGHDYFRGSSEDGRGMPRLAGDMGRTDSGEVEMTDFQRAGPSSEEQAGTRAGYQIDERLRRRNTETSPVRRGSGLDGDTSLADLSPLGDSQEQQGLQHSRSVGRPPTTARGPQPRLQNSSGGQPKKETLFQRIKRAASQPALAGPSAPALSQAAQSAIASVASITSDSSFTTLQRVGSATQGSQGKTAKKD